MDFPNITNVNIKPTEQMEGVTQNPSTISLAIEAIVFLADRTGSSVPAIVKHIKAIGFEVVDDRRFSRLVLRVLKTAVIRGDVVRIKNSFKLSKEAKAKRNKLKAKEARKMAKEAQDKLIKFKKLMANEARKMARKNVKSTAVAQAQAALEKAAEDQAAMEEGAEDQEAQEEGAEDQEAQEEAAEDQAMQEEAAEAQEEGAEDQAMQEEAAEDQATQEESALYANSTDNEFYYEYSEV